MAGRVEGKVALVTGGSSGIGRASALLLAREGAKVVVADVNCEDGEGTVRIIEEEDGDAIFVETDVSRATDVEAMVRRAVETYGRLDCAFNNAGIKAEEGAYTADYTEDDWDRVIGVNLKGVWLCCKYEIGQMLRQGGGAIVNMSSALGLVGDRNHPAYVASKHGVIGLTQAAALEYAPQHIRVNALCPGWVDTPMTRDDLDNPEMTEGIMAQEPMARVGTPEEVAEAVVWLCSDGASFVTGHAMAVDGGYVAQ